MHKIVNLEKQSYEVMPKRLPPPMRGERPHDIHGIPYPMVVQLETPGGPGPPSIIRPSWQPLALDYRLRAIKVLGAPGSVVGILPNVLRNAQMAPAVWCSSVIAWRAPLAPRASVPPRRIDDFRPPSVLVGWSVALFNCDYRGRHISWTSEGRAINEWCSRQAGQPIDMGLCLPGYALISKSYSSKEQAHVWSRRLPIYKT
ncbi:hypothetical protein GWK47_047079 [Chionoecetes opilio]|uniref:Uncharacterized protein n=1 Tax=Chionoecetes opilio TaxID=41210 RepID=A0A8J5CT83_CHIOP|nr:hypothetical protein GWK47_047079 [Chionoecetes opilio]